MTSGGGRRAPRARGDPQVDRRGQLPAAVEYLCREYAKVVRAIWEREHAEEQGRADE